MRVSRRINTFRAVDRLSAGRRLVGIINQRRRVVAAEAEPRSQYVVYMLHIYNAAIRAVDISRGTSPRARRLPSRAP